LLLVCGGLLLLPDAPLLLVAALLAWWLARHPLSRPMGVAGALGLGVILGRGESRGRPVPGHPGSRTPLVLVRPGLACWGVLTTTVLPQLGRDLVQD
jgi:hypothetical protein